MADNFGVSFVPGQDPRQRGGPGGGGDLPAGSPLQQAIKFLSLRLPRFSGPGVVASPTLINGPGSGGLPPGPPVPLPMPPGPMPMPWGPPPGGGRPPVVTHGGTPSLPPGSPAPPPKIGVIEPPAPTPYEGPGRPGAGDPGTYSGDPRNPSVPYQQFDGGGMPPSGMSPQGLLDYLRMQGGGYY